VLAAENRRVPAGAAVLRGDITEAIQAAVVEELAVVGYGRLSIEGVARRAGVAKTAVYRRWPSKLEMVLEVISGVAEQKVPLPDTGSLQGDLWILLQILAKALRHPLASQVIPDLMAEAARNDQIAATLQLALRTNQQEIGSLVIGRAVRRGELPADTDPHLAVDLIVGPVYWHVVVARNPVPAGYLQRLAAGVMAALGATPQDPAAA
jgi:AcrR family transcriptional regulator